MIQQIATVAVYVDDQERALEFWRDRMGFEMRRRESIGKAGSWLEVAPKGAGSRLVLYPKSLMTNWQQLKPSIVFECDDLQAAWRYGPKAWSSWASPRRWRGARTCCSAIQTATSSSSEERSRSSACLSLLRPAFETVSPRLLCHSGMMKRILRALWNIDYFHVGGTRLTVAQACATFPPNSGLHTDNIAG